MWNFEISKWPEAWENEPIKQGNTKIPDSRAWLPHCQSYSSIPIRFDVLLEKGVTLNNIKINIATWARPHKPQHYVLLRPLNG